LEVKQYSGFWNWNVVADGTDDALGGLRGLAMASGDKPTIEAAKQMAERVAAKLTELIQ
jgi:hypothetical protein